MSIDLAADARAPGEGSSDRRPLSSLYRAAATGLGGSMTVVSAGSGAIADVIWRLRGLGLATPANGRGAATERAPSRGRAEVEHSSSEYPGRRSTGGNRRNWGKDGIPDQPLGSHDTFPARGHRSLPLDRVVTSVGCWRTS